MLFGGERCINTYPSRRTVQPTFSRLTAMGVIVLTLFIAYWLFFPGPSLIQTTQADGQVYFAANRRFVLNSSDCVILRWSVENISAVYLNDQPQIGEGESLYCQPDTPPTLTVQFRNDTQETYRLPITVLLHSPFFIGLGILLFITLILRRDHFAGFTQRPVCLVILIVVSGVVLFSFISQLIQSSQTVSTTDWVRATQATTQLIGDLALLFVIIALGWVITQKFFHLSDDEPKPAYRLALAWLVGIAGTLVIVAGIILLVNPRGMYFNDAYQPYDLLIRGQKTDTFLNLAETPDLVIMGSSRAFTLPPAYIQEKTGMTAYNMAIEGGRIEDFLIQIRKMTSFPDVLLIEVQEGLPRQPEDIAARAPLNWLPYMHHETALLTLQIRLTGLFDLNQLAEAIYTTHYYDWYGRTQKEWPLFHADGFAFRPPLTASELEYQVLLDIGRIPAVRCNEVDARSQADGIELVHLAKAQNTSVVFYISPRHPRYYEALMRDDPEYQACYAATITYLHQLAYSEPNVFFLDFSQLSSIDGLDTEEGFYDSQHFTEVNSRRLIEHSVDTLRRAYALAVTQS
jgi:hypothetical protein